MGENPGHRFAPYHLEPDPESGEPPPQRVATQLFRDSTRNVLSRNRSPDLPFDLSLNPYRGCEHGCVYCYARCYHEYLGFSAGLDFETRIVVKPEAPRLLREALSRPSWRPQVVAFSGGTDCYQPLERELRITRGCLEVLQDFRNPVSLITKNHLVTRDVEILADQASRDGAVVWISLISLDPQLVGDLEPRTSSPRMRLEAVRLLASHGIPTGLMLAPVIPGLTDHEVPALVAAAAEAGARAVSLSPLRLPGSVEPIFRHWLEEERPGQARKVLGGLRDEGRERFWRVTEQLFEAARRSHGLEDHLPSPSAAHFRDPAGQQLRLFV